MVSAYLADALRDPTGELQELYANSTSDDFPAEVSKHFSRVFEQDEAFQQIPPLNLQNPPESHANRALVRFRAMVQDPSTSAEMYLARNKDGMLCGWGIEEADDADHDDVDYTNLRECTILWGVTVPGESLWVSEELDGPEFGSTKPASSSSSPYKSFRPHKMPHGDDALLGVQIKVYDGPHTENLNSTDIATFVGILTHEPLVLESEDPLVVPTLHVLYVSPDRQTSVSRPYPSQDQHEAAPIRQDLIKWLAEEGLAGDLEAAEWTLLLCLATVQSRNPPLLPPSLTISRFPIPPPSPTSGGTAALPRSTLSVLLPLILPLVHTLSLSIDLLNRVPFEPESIDEDLHAGALQIPKRSVLVVTEQGIQEGKLLERGLTNIRAMQEVMTSQSLVYSFPFSSFSFPTDITCIVTTEGSKSAFFKTDITIPLDAPVTPSGISNLYKSVGNVRMPSAEQLLAFRSLIVSARSGKVSVSETTGKYIQQDFVRDRQQDMSITSDDLIRRMAVAKLYALSCNSTELTVDIWERSKALDKNRKARLS